MQTVYLFDYDGVIADSLDYFEESFLQACAALGFDNISDRNAFLSLFDTNFYEGLRQHGVPPAQFRLLFEEMDRRLIRQRKQYSLFPGIEETIGQLHQSGPIYIITSNTRHAVLRFLEQRRIARFFRDVLGCETAIGKTEKISRIRETHTDCECWYIGDTCGDILEAKAAGVRTVGAAWGWHGAERLKKHKPDRIAKNPEELIRLFLI